MSTARLTRARISNVFYRWWIVPPGTFLYLLSIGSAFHRFSAFLNPMVAGPGWPGVATSGACAVSRLRDRIEGPVVGPLTDTFGSANLLIGIGLPMQASSRSNTLALTGRGGNCTNLVTEEAAGVAGQSCHRLRGEWGSHL